MRRSSSRLAGTLFCAALLAAPAARAEAPLRILPLGDSITEGWAGYASYRYWLAKELERRGIAFDFVGSRSGVFRGEPRFSDFDADHEGHWGWTTGQVLERIDGWARAARADVALVHLGTNDLARSPERMIENLEVIVGRLRAANPGVVVFLARVIPIAGFPPERLDAANDAIEALGRRLSAPRSPVLVVAQDAGFDAEADTYDGVHPNEAGERKMARRWLEAILEWRGRAKATATPES